MKVQTQPASVAKVDSLNQTPAVPVAPQPQEDKKSRDQVLSEIVEDCVVSPRDYLRDSVACTGE